MLQLIVHGIVINVKFKSLYNPGLAAVIFLHWPIGIYYIHYVLVRDLASTKDFVWGAVATLLGAFLMIILPIRVLGSKASPFAFRTEEMYRSGKEKLEGLLHS